MTSNFSRPKTDRLLGLTVFGLVLFGLVMVYSASEIVGFRVFGNDKFFIERQLIWAILGLGGMVVIMNISYQQWKRWAAWMLIITFVLLISVFLFSSGEINGAHRWIQIGGQGGLTFQPAELAKLTFIIYLAAWLEGRKTKIKDIIGTFLPFVGVLALLSLLILKQPDFGTLSIIIASAIAIYFVAGLTWQQVSLGILITVVSLSIILASPYRRARLATFIDPSNDPSGISYHVNNIAIAIGSGGPIGLGFGQSKQKLLFLPEPYTDSIFAVISEELGSARSVLLIGVFLFVIYRGLVIAARAPDLFGRLMATGITSWFGFQAFINLGSMLHLVPLVGVPLPFVSYGGTNLVISLLAMGMLLNISAQVKPLEKEKEVKRSNHG